VRAAAARFTSAFSPATIVEKSAVGATPGVGLVADLHVRKVASAVLVVKENHAVGTEGGAKSDHPCDKHNFQDKR
jgi:hypothetical protein